MQHQNSVKGLAAGGWVMTRSTQPITRAGDCPVDVVQNTSGGGFRTLVAHAWV